MSVAIKSPPDIAPTNALPLYRFTVAQYHRMIRAGILSDEDRVELLKGWIIDKMPHNPAHDGTLTRILRRLSREVPDDWLIRVQAAITLPESEPEPDVTIVQGPEEVYFERHPKPRDIGLLIEVADTSLNRDRTFKRPLYAQARIPVYWIINLPESRIEVYTHPKTGRQPGYRRHQDYGRDEVLPLILGEQQVALIPVRDLLAPERK